MRIVIDMQGAQTESRFRGIGRYTLSFARAVVRNSGEHEIILALNGLFPDTIEPIRAAFNGLLPQENIRVWDAPGPVREAYPDNDVRRNVAELVREAFLASLQPDVIHISSLFEGYVDDAVTSIGRFDLRTPVSVSLYDLIPLLNPEHYLKPNPSYAEYYDRKVGYLKDASLYLAISEFSRQEGLAHLEAAESCFVNVSTAIDPCFQCLSIHDAQAALLCHKFGLTRPFVLYTGGADERKNLARLVQAFATLPAKLRANHQLLLAGKISQSDLAHLQYLAKKSNLKTDELCFTGYVTDEELVQLYNLCKLFVFPSWHEGFGLPALEAMACGAAVIGANTSSLPEVISLDAALFDPLDVSSIAAKMALALEDDGFRAELRQHSLQQAKRFSWDESAKRAIMAWQSLKKSISRPVAASSPNGRKPKLAFVSPLPPERTGIADYSAELLPALAKHYDIDVVVAQDRVDEPWVNHNSTIRDVSWLRAHAHQMDRVVYQIGNSPFHQHMLSLIKEIPGTVVLHDFYLSGLMAWLELVADQDRSWVESLYQSHGYGAVRDMYLDSQAAKREYPVNFHVLQYAQGLIVHSDYSRKLAEKWYGAGFAVEWEVIPHLRSPVVGLDRVTARRHLGMDSEEFVICSFGFLDSTKLNHRLLDAWLDSALAHDKQCSLIFVGENHGGDYGANLLEKIRSSGLGDRIRVTGFASPEKFRQYLAAADMAVQLRTQSRGETSGTVLDCMNYALPLIVNANGSMAELDSDAVWMLQDEFNDLALVEALEILWREPARRLSLGARAKEIIRRRHAPTECARRYAEAIERFNDRAVAATPALIDAITGSRKFVPGDAELIQLSRSIATTLPLCRPAMRLFLDVTATFRNDLRTGIERVARALLLALLEDPPPGYRIEPIYLCDAGGEWHYRHASRYALELFGCPLEALNDEVVLPQCGDVLLGLDLSGDMLVQAAGAGLFSDYRNRGVSVYSVVFDLLPVRLPDVFPPGSDQNHSAWLRAISKFDGAICISKAVADDLTAWQTEQNIDFKDRRSFRINWFHLGADVGSSSPSQGLPDNAEWTLRQLRARPSFLMVGTIEPRKGYLQAIDAFSQLWSEGAEINLVIVGKEGWKGLPEMARRDIPRTIECLRSHSELNRHLFFLESISDEYLEKVYGASACLIAASFGEGFGLPLIEAAQYKLPIIARDIPVFREVAGENAYFFEAEHGSSGLVAATRTWLQLYENRAHPKSDGMLWLTWKKSAEQLLNGIFFEGA